MTTGYLHLGGMTSGDSFMRVLCMYQSVPALTPTCCLSYWQIACSFVIGCIPRHVHVTLATS